MNYPPISLHMFLLVLFLLCLKSANTLPESEANNMTMMTMRCVERERQALLIFKASLVDDYGRLSSWGSGTQQNDCCKWEGIRCSNQTGHVTMLNLTAPYSYQRSELRGKVSPSLLELHYLNYLDLSRNDFGNTPIPNFIGSLSKLKYLDLSFAGFAGSIPSQLGNLSKLKYLNLRNAGFGGSIPSQLGNLSNLHHLDLSFNNEIKVENLEWLSHLSSLEYLDLSYVDLSRANHWVDITKGLPFLSYLGLQDCQLSRVMYPTHSLLNSSTSIATLDLSYNNFTSSIYTWLFNLTSTSSLVELYLGLNNLKGPIPDAFRNLTSLSDLYLSENQLEGVSPKSFRNLCNLQTLDISYNSLSGQLADFLPNLSCAEVSLEELAWRNNTLSGSLADFTSFSSLRELNLEQNRLNGCLPKTFGQLSKLETLSLSFNSLECVISEVHFLNLTKLKFLDLSFNNFTFNLSSEWVAPFQLHTISLRHCNSGPLFPKWLQTQRNFSRLDLSHNGISDTIPMWFWDVSSRVQMLNLSSNNIRGMVPDLSSKFSNYPGIDLSSNFFEGPIPLFPSNLTSLNLSQNKFSGTLSFLCAITDGSLSFLDLSYNLLSGGLPDCLVHFQELLILNLAHNKLSGKIPRYVSSLFQLQTLVLRNNNFFGELPLSLRNCTRLRFMDLGENMFSGNIPAWIGENLSELSFLILRSNKFHGNIPLHLCHLTNLQLLDLSVNNISGTVPHCFNNFTAMVQKGSSLEMTNHQYALSWIHKGSSYYVANYFDMAIVEWKGREFEFGRNLGLLKVIDVSSNKLTGEFPEALTSLLELVALNLSRNKFIGIVPPKIGQLKSLEHLDLSRNRFSGGIPVSMSGLNFLSYLDLSYNSLSGRIPLGTQLQSFGYSTYTGNAELCGPPLTPKCPGDEVAQLSPTIDGNEDIQEDEDEFWRQFYISMALGFSTGFWGICCTLLVNRRWRHAYFLFLSSLGDWLYVTMAVHLIKLKRKFSR